MGRHLVRGMSNFGTENVLQALKAVLLTCEADIGMMSHAIVLESLRTQHTISQLEAREEISDNRIQNL